MNLKLLCFFLLSCVISVIWIAGADWFFDSSPEDLMFRQHVGVSALVEDMGISLYTLPFVGQQVFEAAFPSSTKIDRSPLFIFAFIQIIVLCTLAGFAIRGVSVWRRLALGYGLVLLSSSFIGFCILHWLLRPAIENCCP